MIKTLTALTITLLLTTDATVWADDEDGSIDDNAGRVVRWSPAVEISGFGDIVSSYHGGGVGNSFQIGQAEIDLAADLGSRVGAEMAIAYREDAFALGAFVVGVTVYERAEGTGSFFGINAASVSAGQFDVPFGIDWKVYPSIDRKLISAPLVVEGTHAGWNDYGFAARLGAHWGNLAAFAVNDLAFEGADPHGEELASDGDYAVGGRVGLRPFRSVEIGGSLAISEGRAGALDQELFGADLQYAVGPFAFKGEYIAHTVSPFFEREFQSSGFYFQGLYSARRYYLAARHDSLDGAALSGAAAKRTSAGAGWVINEQCELRFEYQRCSSMMGHCGLTQIAFAF